MVFDSFFRASKPSARVTSRRQKARSRLARLEHLEDRRVLATLYWDGSASGSWATLANWSTVAGGGSDPGAVPTVGDTVVFNATAVTNQLTSLGGSNRAVDQITVSSPGAAINLTGDPNTLQVGIADFSTGVGSFNTGANPLRISSQLKLPAVTGTYTAGASTTFSVSGANIINDLQTGANARTLSVSGGTLAFSAALSSGGFLIDPPTLGPTGAAVTDTTGDIALSANGATPFASSLIAGGGFAPTHTIPNLNDGLYGNSKSWIGNAANATAGIDLPGATVYNVSSFAFGRDNLPGFTDRSDGTYNIYRTLVTSGVNSGLAITGNAATGWESIGTVTVSGGAGTAIRKLYNISQGGAPVSMTGLMIQTVNNGLCIDELEIYGATASFSNTNVNVTASSTLDLGGASVEATIGKLTVAGGTALTLQNAASLTVSGIAGTGAAGSTASISSAAATPALKIAPGGTLDVATSGATLTINSDIVGTTSAVTKTGSGTAILAGTNTYGGLSSGGYLISTPTVGPTGPSVTNTAGDIALSANGSTAFASSLIAGGAFAPTHTIPNLNDGLYGNPKSWIGDTPNATAGIDLPGATVYNVSSIAFGRDNTSPPSFFDRSDGNYIIYRTLVTAGVNSSLPVTGNAATGWESIGTVTVFGIYSRKVYTITQGGSPVSMTGLMIQTVNNGSCIDELEIYGTPATSPSTVVNAGTLQFAKQSSLYNNDPSRWTAANITVASGATLALNVGGVNEFTTGDLATLLDGSHLGASTGSTGLLSGSTLGLDTTNAAGGNFTHSTAIANPGGNMLGVTKLGTNTLTFGGLSNSFSGPLTVANGTLSISNWNNSSTNGPLGNSATNVILGTASTQGTLQYTGAPSNDPANLRGLNIAAGGGKVQLSFPIPNVGGQYVHLQGASLTGSGPLTVDTSNAGVMTSRFILVGAAPLFTGPITVNANTQLQSNAQASGDTALFGVGSTGTGPAITMNIGSILDVYAFGGLYNPTVLIGSLSGTGTVQGEAAGNYTFKISGDNTSTTFSGVISGGNGATSVAVTKVGTGTLTLSGNNSFQGLLTVAAGTLSIPAWNNNGANGPLGNSATPVTLGGAATQGTLQYIGPASNSPATLKGLNIAAGGGKVQLSFVGGTPPGQYVHLQGASLTGSGPLTVDTSNAGTMTSRFILVGASLFSGPITVNANTQLQSNAQASGDTALFGVGSTGTGPAITMNSGSILDVYAFGGLYNPTVLIGSLSGTGTVQGEAAGNYTFKIGGDNTSTTFSGVISGGNGATSVALTKVGTGALTLAGANTYGGATTISQGTLNINAVTTGTNNANFFGGQQFSSSAIAVSSGALINFNLAGNFASANGGTTITGAGTVRLSSGNWWLGNAGGGTVISMSAGGLIDVQGGVLKNDYANANWTANQASLNVAAGAQFDLRNNNTRIDALTGGGSVFDAGYTNSLTLGVANGSGNFTGGIGTLGNTMSVVKNGNGTQTFSGVTSYIGATTVTGGTLSINQVGPGSNNANIGVGANTQLTTSSLNVSSGALAILNTGSNFSSSNTGTTLTGAGTIRLASGVWWLGNAGGGTAISMSPGGMFDVAGGKLTNDYANSNWSANQGSLNVAAGAQFDLRNNNAVVDALTGGGSIYDAGYTNTLTVGVANGSGTFSGTLGVGGTTMSLIKNGTGTETLEGLNTYTGTTTVNAGILRTGSARQAYQITNPANQNANQAHPGSLGYDFRVGAGKSVTVTQLGFYDGNPSGLLTSHTVTISSLGGATNYIAATVPAGSGAPLVNGYRFVALATPLVLGPGDYTIWGDNYGTDPNYNSGGGIVGPTDSGAAGELTFINGSRYGSASTYPGSGDGGPAYRYGAVSFVFTATANILPATTAVTVANGATLDLNVHQTIASLTGPGGSTVNVNGVNLTVSGTTSTTFSGAINGTGSLTKAGSGTLILSGPNAYSGVTTVSAGILQAASNTALGDTAAGTVVQDGATLALPGGVALGNESIAAAGSGVGGLGAIRNLGGTNSIAGPITMLANANTSTPAASVTMQNGTASFSQGTFSPAQMIDGNLVVSAGGWANAGNPAGSNAVFETSANLNPTGVPTQLSFSIFSGGYGGHMIGKFKLYVTTDNRGLFADGLSNGGQIGSNWIELTPTSAVSTGGATLTINADNSVLASGAAPDPDTYTVKATTSLANITGIRIETIKDASLPVSGPGRAGGNGNYVIIEWSATSTALDTANLTIASDSGDLNLGNTISNANAFGTLTFAGAGNVNLGATSGIYQMAGTTNVVKNGGGTLTLGAVNYYTGATTINGGSLKLQTPTVTLPTSIPGNTVWLDANDVNGTGINVANLTQIGAWVNKAPGGGVGNFTNPNGAQPVVVTAGNTFNGRANVHFWGGLLNNPAVVGNNVTVMYVGRLDGGANNRLVGSLGNNWLLGYWGNTMDSAYFNNGFLNLGPAPDYLGHLYAGTVDSAGQGLFYSNGTQLGGAVAGSQGPNNLSLGGGAIGIGEQSYGDIAEVLVFNSVLSPVQRVQMEQYLAAKWYGVLPSKTAINITSSGASLDLNGVNQTVGSIAGVVGSEIKLGGATLTTGANHTNTNFSGTITGSGGLAKVGSGILTLSGTAPNTFTGQTLLQQGSLALSKSANVVAIPGDIVITNSLNASMWMTADNQLGGSGVLTFLNEVNASISNGWFLLNGTTQSLAGIVELDGFRNGVVENSQTGAPNAPLNSGTGTLVLTGSGNYSYNGYLRNYDPGTFALNKTGSGTQTFVGDRISYTGATTVSGGTLKLSNTTAFASPSTVNPGGTLQLANEATTGSTGFVLGSTINLNGGALTYTGTNFANTWVVLTGAVTATAPSTINIAPTSSNNTGLFFDGGLKGSATTTINAFVPRTGANFRNNNTDFSGTLIVNGIASTTAGTGSGIGVGGNTGGLQNANIQLNGTMELLNQGIGWANTAPGDFFMGALSGSGVMVGNFTGGGQTRVRVGNNNASGAFSGVIADGTGNQVVLTKNGSGTQTLSGINTYSGTTTVNGGTLQLQNGAAIADGAGAVSVGLGATLQLLSSETVSSYVGAGDGVGSNDSTLALGNNVLTTTGAAAIANVTTGGSGGIVAGTAITDNDDDNNVTGAGIFLQASTGIGVGNAIDTTVSNLEASTATGGIFVANAGALSIGNVSPVLTGVDVTGGSGDISLVASGTINIVTANEDVSGPGHITLNAQGATSDINLGAGGAFTINATGGSSLVSLSAGQDVGFGFGGAYGDTLIAGSLLVTSGRDTLIRTDTFVDVNGAGTNTVNSGRDIILANDNSNSRLSTRGGVITLTAQRNVVANVQGFHQYTITSTQSEQGVNTPGGANITITATTGSISLGDGVNAGTTGDVTLSAPLGAITDINLNGTSRIVGEKLAARAATGIAGSGVNALETSVGTLAAENTGTGDIRIANDLTSILTLGNLSPVTAGFALRNLGGAITVTNAGGMTVNNIVSATGAVALTGGDQPAAGNDVLLNANITSSGSSVAITSGDDLTLSAGVTATATTTITLTADPTAGNADAAGATMNLLGALVAPNGATVNTGGDSDLVNVTLPAASNATVQVNTGGGSDTINVNTSGGGVVTLDGQEGADTYNIHLGNTVGSNLLATVNVSDSGASGTDQVILDAVGVADDFFFITASQVIRDQGLLPNTPPALPYDTVNYSASIEQLRVFGLDGNDEFDVTPSASTEMFIDGDNPSTLPGDHLIFRAGGLAVSDNGTQLTRAGALPVNYVEIERITIAQANLTIGGSGGNDTLDVTATSVDDGSYVLTLAGVPGPAVGFIDLLGLTFNGNAGNDELIIRNAPGTLFRPQTGLLAFDGGADSDRLILTGGGPATSETIQFTAPGGGSVATTNALGTQTVSFLGLDDRITDNVPVTGQFQVLGDSQNTQFALQNTAVPFVGDLLTADNLADVYFDNKGRFALDAGGGNDQVEVLLTTPNSGITGLTLAGGLGNDSFGSAANYLKPLPTLALIIQGNDPVGPQPPLGNTVGDELFLDMTAATGIVAVDTVAGTATGGGFRPVGFNSIEAFHLRDDGRAFPGFEVGDVYFGTTGAADTIVVQRPAGGGPNALQIRLNNLPQPLVYPTRRLTINSGIGDDKITIGTGTVVGGGTSPLQGFDLYGGSGNDYLAGGGQNDRLFGGVGNDTYLGGAGDDELGIDPDDPADLGAGNDKGDGGAGNDVIREGLGIDNLTGNTGNDVVYGGDGNDILGGAAGNDRIYGGAGNDSLVGNSGNDLLVGGDGDDRLLGEDGLDILIGGAGADQLSGGNGDDIMLAGWLSVDLTAGGTATNSTLPEDAYDEVLTALIGAWGSLGINGRAALQSPGVSTPLGSTQLDLTHIFSADGAADTLNGNGTNDGSDWLFYSLDGSPTTKDKALLGAGDIGELS